ncbi:MAG: trypsin-like peptidase domain-containing protein [Clostridia bacterium]|nr:trypsin-like peptidase domain-containing protein [Clostridia bacterium]
MTRVHARYVSAALIFLFLTIGLFARERAEENAAFFSSGSPFTEAAERVSQSVVGVSNYIGGERALMGSGVVISDKYILTNYHVIEGAEKLTVSFAGKEIKAAVCAYDHALDAAVLHAGRLTCAPVRMGDSDRLSVGEWVICVGNPLHDALRGTVTAGIVSALERQVSSAQTMIQTDAAINSGSSGGGLFNVRGELVGIPTMKYTGGTVEGIGLAIPLNSVKPLIQKAVGGG